MATTNQEDPQVAVRDAAEPPPPAPGTLPLHKRSSSHFELSDRQRGAAHSRKGRVRLRINGTRALARVDGTGQQPYRVGLDWKRVPSKRLLDTFCECERFAKGRPCEHLWATLLVLADAHAESQPPGTDRVALHKDTAAAWRDLGSDLVERTASKSRGKRRERRPAQRRHRRGRSAKGATAPTWQSQLELLREEVENEAEEAATTPIESRGLRFLVNTTASRGSDGLILELFEPRRRAAKRSAKLQRAHVDAAELEGLLRSKLATDDAQEAPAIITALPPDPSSRGGARRGRHGPARIERTRVRRFRLPPGLYEPLLPRLCAERSLGWWDGRARSEIHPLSWDPGPPWRLGVRLEATKSSARLVGSLEREGETASLDDVLLVAPFTAAADGNRSTAFLVFPKRLARLETPGELDLSWLRALHELGEIAVPLERLPEALTVLVEIPGLPPLESPEEFQLTELEAPLQPRLVLDSDAASVLPNAPLSCRQSFLYGELEVSAEDARPVVIDWKQRTFLRRDMDGEHNAILRLLEAGATPVQSGDDHDLQVRPSELPLVVEPLLAEGWAVEVRGTTLRLPSTPALRVKSGIDWFELSGNADFAGDRVELKKILDAISKGDRMLELEDGSKGLLPAAWLETYDSLAKLAHGESDEGLRFLPSQALLVDVLLAAMPPADVDGAFAGLREKLRSFESIKPKNTPRGFQGTLRNYQREGLGWLGFLREFGLGGVLADDMGLGKTVQVLALIRAHRTPSKTTGLPSLVIAPRSLVYNWIDEASRFTPNLQVVEYHGPGREALQAQIDDYDIVVTTYGTLRRDVDFLATVEFDTLILDEAQAIKNRESQAAKASRLIRARHKLALTGTPIENHLGELGSLFEVLNPGLLGSMPRLEVLSSGRNASQQELSLVAEGLRPFILRRTKAQVLKDLPPKTEQVLFCTLHEEQQEVYDKLRAAYQASLLGEVEAEGGSISALRVLEALLRLRQVACHPGLVDPTWEEAGSAKLDVLFDQVAEVLDEGHKVLVFSQFTSLLAYVRKHLDEQGTPYAYLDGQTRDRAAVVERFQTDPSCGLFLISLKAGGLGLNLTSAGYVFLLDPWWNPAVEAQAIDRAHRIGQTQPVFAYRLIARGTVEEKILELQRSKRQIAEAILEGGRGSVADLTADDLRMLLS